MRIDQFSKFVSDSELVNIELQDTVIVVAGTNFFSRSYQDSGLTHDLGCESHLYADYLRKYLTMFKRASIKCYFLFDGCKDNREKSLQDEVHDETLASPIFMRNIYMEVLDEMGFEYIVCEYSSKRDVIAMGQKLDCPVISDDIEFCFSGCRYIPSPELRFNEHRNTIECRYFLLDLFLEKYNLTGDKMAIFVTLTDLQLFPEGKFAKFFQQIRAPANNNYRRNCFLMQWLSKRTPHQVLKVVENSTTKDDFNNFTSLMSQAKLMIGRSEAGGVGMKWLTMHGAPSAAGTGNWFPAGVSDKHVAIDYIHLYRYKEFHGSKVLKPLRCEDDPMFISLDIPKYALDLLTDYQNDGFVFVSDTKSGRQTLTITEAHSTPRPNYEAHVSVFERGWSEVRQLGLLEHFLQASLQRPLRALGGAPRGARLLLAALLLWSRRAAAAAAPVAAAVLLSYVTLSLVFRKMDKNEKNLPKSPFYCKPILSPSTDKDDVTEADCNIAAAIMEEYVTTSAEEISEIYEEEAVYPLVQFQHCLSQLAELNALCGAPLAPPALRRTFCGPLAYKLRRAIAGQHPRHFINELLCPAPTVLAFYNGLMDIYEMML